MPNDYGIKETQKASLEAVLVKSYPPPFLRWLYGIGLERIAHDHPALVQHRAAFPLLGKTGSPLKAVLVEVLGSALLDPTECLALFESLPESGQRALATIVWEGPTPLSVLESLLGKPMAELNPDKRRWHRDPFILHDEYGFGCLQRIRERRWLGYGVYEAPPDKADYAVYLPQSLVPLFKEAIPAPADYNLRPLDDMDGSALRYTCEATAIRDLKLVAEYIQQGHLKYTKAEKLSKPCIRNVRAMTPASEFFEQTNDGDLELLRSRLLVGALAFAGDSAREGLLGASDALPVRALFDALAKVPAFFAEELQDHLVGSRRTWLEFDPDGVGKLIAFFSRFPSGKWVSAHNIRLYHRLRDSLPTLFSDPPLGFEVRVAETADSWSTRVYVRERNVFELASEPLLKGFAFFLAALGLAEIAYTKPKHENFSRPRRAYLTPFDGLLGVRLTPLGEFVFGKRDDYQIAEDAPPHAAVVLDATRLLAFCPDVDPLTELALKQFMETLSPGHYRMTHKSLLGGCASRRELEARIGLFRRVISETPPAIWERFFESTLSRISPLAPEPERVVLKIDGDEEMRRLFAVDPVLRKHSLKVEGLRIAVLRSEMKTIAKRLEHFGYLCPVSSLLPKDE